MASDGPIFIDRSQVEGPPTMETSEGWEFWVLSFEHAFSGIAILKTALECQRTGKALEFDDIENLTPLGEGLGRYDWARGLVTLLGQTISILTHMGVSSPELVASCQKIIMTARAEFNEQLESDPILRSMVQKSQGDA
jgi:hypothetical protein